MEKLSEDNNKLYDLCQELNFSLKENENLKNIITVNIQIISLF